MTNLQHAIVPEQDPSPVRTSKLVNAAYALAVALLLAMLCGCNTSNTNTGSSPASADNDFEIAEIKDSSAKETAEEEAKAQAAQAIENYQTQLDAAVAEIEASGASISYYLVDLTTGETLEHSADTVYYSASTIKGPFCISLVSEKGAAARSAYGSTIAATISNSDNDAYRTLREAYYPAQFFDMLANEAGAPCDLSHWYAYYGVRDLANLWRAAYPWMSSGDENAIWLGELFGDSLKSQVDDIAAQDGTTTWSKAGWYAGGGPKYDVTFDGGIVNAKFGPYALAVATNRGSDFDCIRSVMDPLVGLWNAQHAK